MNREDEQHQVERRERLRGVRQQKADALKEAQRLQREEQKRLDFEKAQRIVQGGKERPRPSRTASFGDAGEKTVNTKVPAPGKPGTRGRRALPPMHPDADPGAPS